MVRHKNDEVCMAVKNMGFVRFLLGFAFAFYILMPSNPAFSSPISALFKVFVMMMGEYQYEDYFTIEKVTT